MRKNSIIIVIGVTLIAIAVIIVVIIAGVMSSVDEDPDENSGHVSVSSEEVPEYSDALTPSESTVIPSTSDFEPNSSTPSDGAREIVATANSLIGIPFAENGADTDGFDNSGFIYYVLRENGYITCPRTTSEQTKMGAKLEYSQLKEGDLAFFSDGGDERSAFGGIYIGDGKIVGSFQPGQTVKIVDITNDYYMSHFYCGISLS